MKTITRSLNIFQHKIPFETLSTKIVYLSYMNADSTPLVTSQAMSAFQSPLSLHFALLNSISDWKKSCTTQWNPVNTSLPLVTSHPLQVT